jgi:glycosyltransferase involved in cell wall biosynthesis
VYIGSGATWQLPEVVVDTAAKLASSDAALLVLSNAADHFAALARDAGLRDDRFMSRNATPSEIRSLLCAADVALLPRTPTPVNTVAAPVKFAEYLAAGVPVATVRGAGAFAQKVDALGLGAVAEAPDPQQLASAVARILHVEDPHRRARCRAAAEREYDLKRIASRYLQLYARLMPAG